MRDRFTVERMPLQQVLISPAEACFTEQGDLLLDFEKAAFGTLLVPTRCLAGRSELTVHLGEQLTTEGRVNREPEGAIRYICITQLLHGEIDDEQDYVRIVIPPDERNTGPGAIKMPPEVGEVFPFRYAEIEQAQGIEAQGLKRSAVFYPFDDEAASFTSSDKTLDAVWELCKYSIKATSFCGVYVDGDRERIPYEGDAYINQLSHFGVDSEHALARYTYEYLIQNPTWPTEWHLHTVMMGWMDYLYSGERVSLDAFYDDLCVKTLIDLAREDGLISTWSVHGRRALEERLHMHGSTYVFEHGLRDLVDWPPGSFSDGSIGERDNHEMLKINTVVNAFHCHALALMARIARVTGKLEDAHRFTDQAECVRASLNRLLFDDDRGVYVDGEGSMHASLHSNMFMLAFDLVPDARKAGVIAFVKSRGMACSVYGAQYLLEALYLNGEDRYALDLMTNRGDRSWWNMIRVGSSMTLEAWDLKYKNNLDWNHAWGAVPANIIPRFLLGVRPLEPGFRKVLIEPQSGALKHVSGRVPTKRGAVLVSLQASDSGSRCLQVSIPVDVEAVIRLRGCTPETLVVDGSSTVGRVEGDAVCVDGVASGRHEFFYETVQR